ncbi:MULTISPECIES: hypothetical protein [Xanthomonas]|uniref:hypothetical protein n=1 Tax=Xanthomonas TaxID=338 RepID=UPI0010ABB5F9|nr:hypothetical protein [Xanthomonas euvesicatoria]MBV6671534.1 hypothetical protein [Xanthomonas euvesicatoria pv. alangii]MBV6841681.1 hypothetical protein [Xanthomonas campestris pv. fici]MBV6844467.1 hypothetical protein [Xanthomonas campestris pv. paulliniae]MBV6861443.1 hypothetical protein [Xanthomonas campestris pv. blepharidis]MBV6865967.1 hypothetical protein [Xanthomonas campestris pv. coriandri]
MNLPLHFGLLGSLEAGLIAFILGVVVFAAVERGGRRLQFNHGHTLGIACLLAVAIGAGYDIWHLVYTSIVRLESPLYARLALAKIHDPNELGSRVVLEVAGALAGVVLGWKLFSSGSWENDPPSA